MKRTKEAHYQPNPTYNQTSSTSGATFFFGEDQNYHHRTRENQKLQKEYLDQQVETNRRLKEMEKLTKDQFDNQLLKVTQQRGQLEMNKHQRLHEMERAHDQFNLNAAEEKRQREKQEREREEAEERRELELLGQRKVRNYNTRVR